MSELSQGYNIVGLSQVSENDQNLLTICLKMTFI